jgi:hypothetical protein
MVGRPSPLKKDFIRDPEVNELDTMRIEMAKNTSVSKMELINIGTDTHLASEALMHLCVGPMCTALANTGAKNESTNWENSRNPKMIRKKNMADVDGEHIMNAAPMVPITALQFGSFTAMLPTLIFANATKVHSL